MNYLQSVMFVILLSGQTSLTFAIFQFALPIITGNVKHLSSNSFDNDKNNNDNRANSKAPGTLDDFQRQSIIRAYMYLRRNNHIVGKRLSPDANQYYVQNTKNVHEDSEYKKYSILKKLLLM